MSVFQHTCKTALFSIVNTQHVACLLADVKGLFTFT